MHYTLNCHTNITFAPSVKSSVMSTCSNYHSDALISLIMNRTCPQKMILSSVNPFSELC